MILGLVVILVAVPQIPGDCPSQCECKWKSGKDSVICSNSNLTNIPRRLGEGTQILDLSGNPVSNLTKDVFSAAGLLNLQKIFISKCKVRTIDKYAFRKLSNLVELDLSYNVLSTVPSHSFDSIPELRELKLNGNPIKKITNDAFAMLGQLVKLEMTECHISFLDPRAFSGLEHTLEWLKLDRNRLAEARSNTLTGFLNLHGLELAGNPWNCTCHLRTLRLWMTSQKIPSSDPPGCRNPARVAGKTWDKLSVDEFACRPTIEAVPSSVSAEESTNVTLTCAVFGSPKPNVKWMWKNRQINNASGGSIPAHKKTYVLNHLDNKTFLTIYSVEPSDTGLYFCVASNKAGKVEGNVTLTVNRQNPESKLNSKILFSGAIVALLFLVASCLLICFLGQPRKENRSAQVDNYEKIEMDKKCSARYSEITTTNKVHPKMREYRGVPSGEEAEGDEDAGTPTSNPSEQGRIALLPYVRETTSKELYPEIPTGVQQHILRKEVLPTGSLYTTATTYEDRERNYPDLVTAPPAATAHYSSATLPRSNKNWYPRVSSSQSPLLAGSRCGSSADDSMCLNRRFSAESRSSSYYRLARAGDRSASSLNLDQEIGSYHVKNKQWHHPSLPTSPVRHRPSDGARLSGQSETPILNLLGSAVYDYHAAQLERFLEEYRSLQDQLNRMKETCEGFLELPKPESPTDPMYRNRYTSSSIYNDLYRT